MVYYYNDLANIDPDSIETMLYTIIYTLVFFSIIFILSFLVSYNFHTFKNVLRTKEKVFWCLAFVRGFFGVTGTVIGVYFLLIDNTLKDDIVYGKTITSSLVIYYAIGFFLFECIALNVSSIVFRFFDGFLFVHHAFSLIGFSLTGYYSQGHFFTAVGLILEASTPFTCVCWMLLKADYAHTLLWKVNQLVLVHLFHCRTMIEGYFIAMACYNWRRVTSEMPVSLLICLYVMIPIQFAVLTPYWTYKKTQQLMKPMDFNHSPDDPITKAHTD